MIYSGSGQFAATRLAGLSPAALRAMTRWTAPALCPELELPALPEGLDLDGFRTANGAAIGADVPYWVVAWPGGQALARFLLDHPGTVVGRCVVDLGCGAGIVAAAAMRAGAARAVAVDSDPNALIAAAETARRNGVAITTHRADIERFIPEPGAIICAGDLWYERQIARRATSALRRLAEGGHQVLCGDPGRPDRPRQRAVERAHYSVPVSETFERHSPVECRVFELEALNIPPAHSYHASHAGARGGQ